MFDNLPERHPFKLPIPDDVKARPRAFAYDLAYGAIYGYWKPVLAVVKNTNLIESDYPGSGETLLNYLLHKWVNVDLRIDHPSIQLLTIYGYLEYAGNINLNKESYRLTQKALALVEYAPPTSIFISYNRRQSSPFALLILNLFKTEGIEAFLDIRSIAPGDDWHGLIEEEVKKRENFIVLLNRSTLRSKYVRQEIRWAIESGTSKRVIPIFHGGLKPKNFKDDEFQELLTKNAIIVEQETAIAYESALLQLLNYFGRTP
ncbi:MAG: hypothetical protein BroJett018_42930 [Chloroflexota bacterium]|nr:toll/interleukin-1 receptor domain-containing protein [Chloroflexota bacterium]NOG65577.1 toll/interleukin-1 receptor domain-containing protein [Chloroflexota bacterium]GIK66499.1 MAG: hypothetical protein BroJett018_42930 [Chloroflexota bacterium]